MKPLQRLLPNASSICRSCRRTFTTVTPRQNNDNSFISDLENHITRPAPAAATPTPNRTNTGSDTTTNSASEMRRALLNAQKASRPVAFQQEQTSPEDTAGNVFASVLSGMTKAEASLSMEGQMSRKWYPGDVYSVHDLGVREATKWGQLKRRPQRDVFEMIGQDPLKYYKNMPLLSEFISETGRIRHSRLTGLKPKNQRKLAKAIRRAIGSGLMPSVHKHPEVIARQLGIDKYRGRGGGLS